MPTSSTAKKDRQLIRRIAKGSEKAFEKLYESHSTPIYNYLVRLTHEEAIAENLLQETFLAVWEGSAKFRGDAQVKNWIYKIAHHQAVGWLRKTLKDELPREIPITEEHLQKSSLDDPEEAAFTNAQAKDIHRALEQLSATHRAVVELSYVHDFTYGEIARIMDCPKGTVKSRMNYALRQLDGILRRD